MIKKDDKILSIQYLRGLAALGVVLCHYSAYLTLNPVLAAIFNFGQTGVHVFFLISGFIIVYSLTDAGYKTNKFFTFLIKRSIRIDPAYYLTVLLTILLFEYLSAVSPVKTEKFVFVPQQFLAHLSYIVPFTKYAFYMHVFWTLCIEFQFYILIGLLYFITDNWMYKNLFLVLFCLSSFFKWPNTEYVVFTYSSIFATGISLVALYQNKTWLNAITSTLFLGLVGYQFGIPIFLLLTSTSLVILFHSSFIKLLIFLGNLSYSLYLTHTLTLIVLLRVFAKLRLDLNKNPLFWLLIEVLVAIACSNVFYKLIEKPSLAYSKRLFYKRPK